MYTCIAFIRVSTTAQEIESQEVELLDFIRSHGKTDDEIYIIRAKGASAIKLNDLYLQTIEELKTAITIHNTIKDVYLLDLDRLGRNDGILINLKNWFVDHNINLHIKNIGLTLLNDDSTINNGAELTFTLLSVLAQQEMKTKKERFRRGREYNKSIGKWNGGALSWGLTTDKNGFIIVDEEQAATVREIFRMYIEDGYSTYKLAKELNDRGLRTMKGSVFYQGRIYQLLTNTQYMEYGIISKEIFDKVQKMLNEKYCPRGNNYKNIDCLCSRLIVCGTCGCHYIKNHGVYVCCEKHARFKDCDSISVSVKIMDKIAWFVAKNEQIRYMSIDNKRTREEAERSLAAEILKLRKAEEVSKTFDEKITRIDDLYAMGRYNKDKWQEMIDKVEADRTGNKTDINNIHGEIDRLNKIINNIDTVDKEFIKTLVTGMPIDINKRIEIVRNRIMDIKVIKTIINERKLATIEINTVSGDKHIFRYWFVYGKNKPLIEQWNESSKLWTELHI